MRDASPAPRRAGRRWGDKAAVMARAVYWPYDRTRCRQPAAIVAHNPVDLSETRLNSSGVTCPSGPQANHPGQADHGRRRRQAAAAPSASATPRTSIRSCSSTTSGTTSPTDYLAGFPWHPHRGIETITYVLAGTVEHGDSLGNRGHARRRRRPVDDRRQRHPPPGDAEGRSAGADARLPALGQPARRR